MNEHVTQQELHGVKSFMTVNTDISFHTQVFVLNMSFQVALITELLPTVSTCESLVYVVSCCAGSSCTHIATQQQSYDIMMSLVNKPANF